MPSPPAGSPIFPPTDMIRPTPGEQYELWLATERGVANFNAHKNHYQVVCDELFKSFEESLFWQSVLVNLKEVDDKYTIDHKFPLVSTFTPKILIKPWSSLLIKSYRKNISDNNSFPAPPPDGWCVPPEWYSQVHDIIRTTIVVKYIDGVPLILTKLQDIAEDFRLICTSALETREDGYYGAHFSLHTSCDISTMAWDKESRIIQYEIQITTQIKDVIKHLLHTYYETHRLTGKHTRLSDIAWNYRDDEFISTYLGHLLHYVEGMIIEARDRRREKDA